MQTFTYHYVGILIDGNMMIWSVAGILVALSLFLEIYSVDLSNEESCMYWFEVGSAFTASAMLLGFFGEYYGRVASS